MTTTSTNGSSQESPQIDNQDINMDSRALAQLMSTIAKNNGRASDDNFFGATQQLSYKELNNFFRKSNLIRKIITLLPIEGSNAGYTIKHTNSEIISETNIVISEAFCNASIQARLYGKSYLVIESSSDNLKPLKIGSTFVSHKIYQNLHISNDFYLDKDNKKISHASRTFLFYGNLTYLPEVDADDADYSDSVLTGLLTSIKDFLVGTQYTKKILKNLSNLTIGMKGLGGKLRNDVGKEIGERLSSFDLNRSLDESIAYDLENEKIDYITQTLSGIPDVINELKYLFVANTEYDIDKLFPKTSTTGISSGMQNQLIVRFQWATQVKKWVETNYVHNLLKLYNTITNPNIQVMVEISLPLSLTDMEKMELEEKAANRTKILIENGVITAIEARRGYVRGNFDVNIILTDEIPEIADLGVTTHEQIISGDSCEGEDTKETLMKSTLTQESSNVDVENINDKIWIELSNVTMNDIDIIAEEVIEES